MSDLLITAVSSFAIGSALLLATYLDWRDWDHSRRLARQIIVACARSNRQIAILTAVMVRVGFAAREADENFRSFGRIWRASS